jgi:hypothetical protein
MFLLVLLIFNLFIHVVFSYIDLVCELSCHTPSDAQPLIGLLNQ